MNEHFEYEYPPSGAIQQFGEILRDSHFVADGKLILNEGREIDCHFEVAYTKMNDVFVVVYIPLKTLPGQPPSKAKKLHGKDRYWGLHIEIIDLSLTTYSIGSALKIFYFASQFQIRVDNIPESKQYTFSLTNFALPYWFKASINKESGEIERPFFEILAGERHVGKIFYLRDINERTYSMQPLSYLHISQDDLPLGWTIENVADVTCALLSVATGNDIQWFKRELKRDQGWLISPQQTWVSRRVRSTRFYGFLQTYELLFHKEEAEFIQKFVAVSLNTLMKRPFEEIKEYVRILWLYIDFANVDSTSQTHTLAGRLLTTLAEELLTIWEKTERIGKDKSKLLEPNERRKLLEKLPHWFNQEAEHILRKRTDKNETDELYHQRIINIANRLKILVQNVNAENQLREKFYALFEHYDYRIIKPRKTEGYSGSSLYQQITAFVGSRNSLVHSGCLAWENPEWDDEDLQALSYTTDIERNRYFEYDNILMMLPRMFAAIFGYRGQYRNLLIAGASGKWVSPPLIHREEVDHDPESE